MPLFEHPVSDWGVICANVCLMKFHCQKFLHFFKCHMQLMYLKKEHTVAEWNVIRANVCWTKCFGTKVWNAKNESGRFWWPHIYQQQTLIFSSLSISLLLSICLQLYLSPASASLFLNPVYLSYSTFLFRFCMHDHSYYLRLLFWQFIKDVKHSCR